MFKHTASIAVTTSGSQQITPAVALEYTADMESNLDHDVTIASDVQVGFNLDVSSVKSFYMISNVDLTIETNSGTVPDSTISLVANKPYMWNTDSYDAFLLTADITTGLFITSAETGTLKIRSLVDATP